MFRDLNTLELTFCVEFIIILSRVPPTLLTILPPGNLFLNPVYPSPLHHPIGLAKTSLVWGTTTYFRALMMTNLLVEIYLDTYKVDLMA